MNKLIATLVFAAALGACEKSAKNDKKDVTAPKADVGGEKPTPDKVAPDKPAPPPDPFASWSEHRGPGFVVMAPRAPNELQQAGPTGLPMTFLADYEPAGFQGAFQAAVSDTPEGMAPEEILTGSVQGMLANMPGAKVTKDEPIPGNDLGRAIMADGNHPQGGPFQLSAKIFLRAKKIYMVQALYADPKDASLAFKFVDSFKFVD